MRFRNTLISTSLLLASGWCAAQPAATIDQLEWMNGTWQVAVGPNILEEHWVTPTGGSIAAMVRMYGETTSMFEVITIEEKDGTLAMSVQQWDSGFEPRQPEAQQLILSEISDQRVMFEAVTDGPMNKLGYSRLGDTFTIELGGPTGDIRKVDLQPAP
ncbi:MAG: DUF6265 family protein [Gammaproteobacteria bacterium]|nr:DUF6265 family protein [Gammaproteobacteria bacterium]